MRKTPSIRVAQGEASKIDIGLPHSLRALATEPPGSLAAERRLHLDVERRAGKSTCQSCSYAPVQASVGHIHSVACGRQGPPICNACEKRPCAWRDYCRGSLRPCAPSGHRGSAKWDGGAQVMIHIGWPT